MNNGLFNILLKRILPCPPSKIAIAVSGGADSMALLSLMQEWTRRNGITLYPFVVNHGLRPTALKEALCVQQWIKAMGLSANILHWSPSLPLYSGIMEKARHARYELLALACHRRGISHLCVAHHLDDVLETVWMRQNQQSSWRGLAGISALTFHYGIKIVRPLLTTPQLHLHIYLKEKGMPWVEDPSNNNPLFLRTHARQSVKDLSTKERLSLITRTQAYAQQRQREALDLSQKYTMQMQDNFLIITEHHHLQGLRSESGSLLLESWISSFSCHTLKRIQLESLWNTLISQLSGSKANSCKTLMTGGGCLFTLYKNSLYIFREGARIKDTSFQGKKEWIWDYRFFCYGIERINKQNPSSGPWIERYSKSSLPEGWPKNQVLFHWCRPPYPHFMVL